MKFKSITSKTGILRGSSQENLNLLHILARVFLNTALRYPVTETFRFQRTSPQHVVQFHTHQGPVECWIFEAT